MHPFCKFIPALLLSLVVPCLASAEPRPEHMVYLRSIDPSIEQDIRYATAHNFTGHPLDGYEAPECLLSVDAAKALSRVQTALRAQGYGLKVFDCYRPARAVADMGNFAKVAGDPTKAEFYPRVDKQDFWKLGYVARVSGHSKGSTLDLTLTGSGALPAAGIWSPPVHAQPRCAKTRWNRRRGRRNKAPAFSPDSPLPSRKPARAWQWA